MNRAYAGQLAPRAGDDPLLHVPPAYADGITATSGGCCSPTWKSTRAACTGRPRADVRHAAAGAGLGRVGAHYVELPALTTSSASRR